MKRTLLLLFLFFALAGTLALMRNPTTQVSAVIPAIVSFTAAPQAIGPGESVTLNWETRGVDSVTIQWGPENNPRDNMQKRVGLPPSGTMTFQPQEDTIYVLECETVPVQGCIQSASVRVR